MGHSTGRGRAAKRGQAAIRKNQWLRCEAQASRTLAHISKYTTWDFSASSCSAAGGWRWLRWFEAAEWQISLGLCAPSAENSGESPGASFHSLQLPGSMHNIAEPAFVLRRCHRGAGGEIEASSTPAAHQAYMQNTQKMINKHGQEPEEEEDQGFGDIFQNGFKVMFGSYCHSDKKTC